MQDSSFVGIYNYWLALIPHYASTIYIGTGGMISDPLFIASIVILSAAKDKRNYETTNSDEGGLI